MIYIEKQKVCVGVLRGWMGINKEDEREKKKWGEYVGRFWAVCVGGMGEWGWGLDRYGFKI